MATDIVTPITRDTPIQKAGAVGLDLVRQCTYDIECASDAIMKFALQEVQDTDRQAVLRMIGDRIKRLNSILMSFHTGEERALWECHRAVWNGARPLILEGSHD